MRFVTYYRLDFLVSYSAFQPPRSADLRISFGKKCTGHLVVTLKIICRVMSALLTDQWRATQRLTITAGLRYENQRPATERFNRLTYFARMV